MGDTTNAEPAAYLTADEEPESPTCLFEIRDEVTGDLGNPWAIRVGGGTEDVDDASLQLDHEQDVVAAEQHGVDVKEVGGDDALGLGGEELAPSGARSSRSRWETMTAQDRGDARI